jgi:hypothetical protein
MCMYFWDLILSSQTNILLSFNFLHLLSTHGAIFIFRRLYVCCAVPFIHILLSRFKTCWVRCVMNVTKIHFFLHLIVGFINYDIMLSVNLCMKIYRIISITHVCIFLEGKTAATRFFQKVGAYFEAGEINYMKIICCS